MNDHYIVYGGELSYFTRKLEAAMVFYGASWERAAKTDDIERRAGTHQVPVLQTPENWVIADTTPLLAMLDARFPRRAMFPAGPLGVLVHVIEEHFDEWVARTMVHYRWHYEDSARFASERIAAGDPERAARVRQWGPRACRATGTESDRQQRAAEHEYRRILAAAEQQLQETGYLLGERPCAVDCIVLGGLRAHTNIDPDPKQVTARYPTVVEWAERRADTWDGSGKLAQFPESTTFARFVLREMASTYARYALAARQALEAGAKAFTAHIYGEDVSYLTRPYIEQSRRMVAARIDALPAAQRRVVGAWLERAGLRNVFS